MNLIIFITFVVISLGVAEDRELYKTCEQSSFCRRCRYQAGPTPYEVLGNTLSINANGISVEIRNNDSQKSFVMQLRALKVRDCVTIFYRISNNFFPTQDNTFHFEIDEKAPLKPRFRVLEALQEPPNIVGADVVASTTQITVTAPISKAIISLKPFKIEFYEKHDNNVPSVTVNHKGLMRFEHLRTKPLTPDPTEEPGSWEEIFREFIDPKPNGPEAIAMDFTFHGSDILFGIPEHADSFALKSTIGDEPYRLFTSDVPAYTVESRWATYGAVPVIYAHTPERTTGVYWQNSADTFIDIHDTTAAHFMSEAGIIDVFVMLGPTPSDVFTQYTKLTGVGNLPQMFTLGLHQW